MLLGGEKVFVVFLLPGMFFKIGKRVGACASLSEVKGQWGGRSDGMKRGEKGRGGGRYLNENRSA